MRRFWRINHLRSTPILEKKQKIMKPFISKKEQITNVLLFQNDNLFLNLCKERHRKMARLIKNADFFQKTEFKYLLQIEA